MKHGARTLKTLHCHNKKRKQPSGYYLIRRAVPTARQAEGLEDLFSLFGIWSIGVAGGGGGGGLN